MKFLDFNIMDSVIRREFGFNNKMGAYLLIFSFYEFNEKAKANAPEGTEPETRPCILSYNDFAEYLMCAVSNAYNAVQFLLKHGYITATKTSTPSKPNCIAYSINEEKLKEMLKRNPSERFNFLDSGKLTFLKQESQHSRFRKVNLPETGNSTITENKTEIIDRECDALSAPTTAEQRRVLSAIAGKPPAEQRRILHEMSKKRDETLLYYYGHDHNVPLTHAQHRELQQLSEKTGKGLQHYVNECSKSISLKRTKPSEAYTKIKFWILEDAEKREAEQAAGTDAGTRPSDTQTESRSDAGTGASFTDAEFESLANNWI